jgi:hypothetical protein
MKGMMTPRAYPEIFSTKIFTKGKRGQGLSTNAIILIVLGVVVLAVLIIGFTMGWKNIAPWLSSNNVDTIVSQCKTSCTTNSEYNYCSQKRELKAEETLEDVTCFYLSEKQTKYGVDKCPSIECEIYMSATDAGVWCNEEEEGRESEEVTYLTDAGQETMVCSEITL